MKFTMKYFLTSILLVLFSKTMFSAEINKVTETFAVRNGEELKMDIYRSDSTEIQPCLMFLFGGGFKEGARDQKYFSDYLSYFAKTGFTVVSIDYRLLMKNVNSKGLRFVRDLRYAIDIAVEDVFAATNYLINNAERLQIDTTKIIMSGSSAGAISVLHADYVHCNGFEGDTILSDKFNYAGIISYAGGILSNKGVPKYNKKPAPTLLFHGNVDKLVTSNKIQLFNLGMFGSKVIAKQFRKNNYPYVFYSLDNSGHEVAMYPMDDCREEILYFIRNLVFDKKQWMIDVNFTDLNLKPTIKLDVKTVYKSGSNLMY